MVPASNPQWLHEAIKGAVSMTLHKYATFNMPAVEKLAVLKNPIGVRVTEKTSAGKLSIRAPFLRQPPPRTNAHQLGL